MSDNLFEIRLAIRAGIRQDQRLELIKAVLQRNGWHSQDIVEWRQGQRAGFSFYTSSRSAVQKILTTLKVFRLPKSAVRIKPWKKKDWQEKWKEQIRPFVLTRRLYVVPLWWRGLTRGFPGREPIYLDTTLAFGTGLHETTKFLAQMIEDRQGDFATFLDVGTGSGILSIVAGKSGAWQVSGIDVDEGAVAVAQANLAGNGLAYNQVAVADLARLRWKTRFDLVAANLTSLDLLTHRKALAALVRPGKYLAVSGISLERLKDVRRGFQDCPLRVRQVVSGKKWAAVLFLNKS